MRTSWSVGLLLALACSIGGSLGCSKNAHVERPDAPLTAEQDALWALAPEGATAGVVVSPRGLAMIERASVALRAALAAMPELAPVAAKLAAATLAATGVANPTLADFGLSHDRGMALFLTPRGHVAVFALRDRDAFLAKAHGARGADHDTVGPAICAPRGERYVCVEHADQLATLGRGALRETLRAAGARGDVEAAATQLGTLARAGAGVVQLARGEVTVRGALMDAAPEALAKLGTPSRPRDAAQAAGFGMADLAPLLAPLHAQPIALDITVGDLARTIAGPLSFAVPAGTTDFDLRLPLRDPAPFQRLLAACAALPPLNELGATYSDGACHLPVPQLGTTFDAWIVGTAPPSGGAAGRGQAPAVDGSQLRFGRRGGSARPEVIAASPLGATLAGGLWSFAVYARGSLFAGTVPGLPAVGALPDEAQLALRALSALSELGFAIGRDGGTIQIVLGARTIWANPDDVVAKLFAIPADQLLRGPAVNQARAIAQAAPTSPFATDFRAGIGGGGALAPAIGIVAAVAIPAFMDYMKRSKQTEAALQLNRLGKHAKVSYSETGRFPVGDSGPPPATCCGAPRGHCPVVAATWQREPWRTLDFELTEPSLFRYHYASDGRTFTATATGDLDCDGVEIVYTLTGEVDHDQPRVRLTEPPPSAD